MAGFGYAFVPTFLVIILLQVILHKTFLGPLLFDNVKGNAYYFGESSEMVIKTTQQGRMGVILYTPRYIHNNISSECNESLGAKREANCP